MAGKSTLMRSTIVTALLANSGLFVPCTISAKIPRYDSFFMRTASYDIPSEGKSAFALEMDDVKVMLRDCTEGRSLVMMDEIGTVEWYQNEIIDNFLYIFIIVIKSKIKIYYQQNICKPKCNG